MSEPEQGPTGQQEALLAAEGVPGLLELKRKEQEQLQSVSMSIDAENKILAKMVQHEVLSK